VILNNVLLTTACATVLLGTLYPLALEGLTGQKISVGAPYFNMTFGPLMIPVLLALPFGPFLAWKRGDIVAVSQRLMLSGIVALVVAVLCLAVFYRGPWLAPFVLALGVWVMAGAIQELGFRVKLGQLPIGDSWRRLKGLPRSVFGTTVAHFGVGVMVLGIVATSAYRVEDVRVMKPGDRVTIAGYELQFKGVTDRQGPNYQEQVGLFGVSRSGSSVIELQPAKRLYRVPRQATNEAGIHAAWWGDLYTVLGDQQADKKSYAVRLYFNPLVRFIWIGALIMFMGGFLSLTDRRLRVGAPRRSRHLDVPSAPQAAE
ncbi:MAG TPA: cytochrome c-type biogenesis CcmF C-terminal domain-containing protein, partial [Hyphomicrobiaceae bacterium]|nr:cytochrome c-type biogenesis CcmF C-terminal domain-containing protein [Hyphomicrobiaceae bacterium]